MFQRAIVLLVVIMKTYGDMLHWVHLAVKGETIHCMYRNRDYFGYGSVHDTWRPLTIQTFFKVMIISLWNLLQYHSIVRWAIQALWAEPLVMEKLYRGPYINAYCQVWFHLAKLLQRRRLKYEQVNGIFSSETAWHRWSLGVSLSKLCPTAPHSIQDGCCFLR
jgi:hypothetical protein